MADDLLLQAPGETVDYAFDWTDWLAGDNIAARDATPPGSTWSISPAGPTIEFDTIITPEGADSQTQTACFVAGMTLGQVYRLTNTINTAGLRAGQRTLTIRCWAA